MSDDLDLDISAFRQGRDLDSRTSREVGREVFRVDLIHAGKIRKVRHEDSALDDIGEREFLILQDRFYILQHALGLHFDVSGHEVAGGGLDWNLARAKQEIADTYGMIVRTNRSRRLSRFDDSFLRHK